MSTLYWIEFHAEMKNTPAWFEQPKMGTSYPRLSSIVYRSCGREGTKLPQIPTFTLEQLLPPQ